MCSASYGTSSATVSAIRSSRLSRFCSERTWWKTSASRRYDSTSGGTAPMYGARSESARTAAETARRALTNRISAGLEPRQSARSPRTRDASFRKFALLFSVPVVEALDAADDADAPERDLVRARLVADVVGLSRAVGEEGQAAVARPEGMRDTGAGRAGDDVEAPQGMLVVAEQQRAVAVEHDEDLLLGGMAVRRRGHLPGVELDQVQAGPAGSRLSAQCPPPAAMVLPLRRLRLDLVGVQDRGGPFAGLGRVRRPELALALEGRLSLAGGEPRARRPGHAHARQPRAGAALARVAEDEHVEPVVAGLERVRLSGLPVDDAVAGTDGIGLVVLDREAGARQDVERLLVVGMDVERRREEPRRDPEPPHADVDASGSRADERPVGVEVPDLDVTRLELFEVDDRRVRRLRHHRNISRSGGMTSSRAVPSPATSSPRTIATGIPAVLPRTSSAAAAISSATATTVARSS